LSIDTVKNQKEPETSDALVALLSLLKQGVIEAIKEMEIEC